MLRSGLLLALAGLLVAPVAAAAQDASGGAAITLDGSAARILRDSGVDFVATPPASAGRGTLTLPVTTAAIGRTATARHAGVLQLRRGRGARARRLTLTGLRTRFGRRAETTGLLGARRVRVLTYGAARPAIDATAGTVRLSGSVSLSRRIARALHGRLGLRRLGSRRLGRVSLALGLRSDVLPVPAPPPGPAPGPGVPAPAGNLVAGAMTWRPRESFVRYINSEDGGITASDGAVPGPEEVRPGSDAPLVYSFGLPFVSGSADATAATIAFGGTVTFSWPTRGIDIGFSGATVTLGPAADVSFVLAGATAGTAAGSRVRMLALDPAAAASHTVAGASETYERIPATLTAEGAGAFAGYYAAGDEFGTVSVTYTKAP